MKHGQNSTTAQLRNEIDKGKTGSKSAAADPAAAPLGTDDEAAGTPPSSDRVEMARETERRIGDAAGCAKHEIDSEQAQEQRGSSAPYAKEDHMNRELLERSKEGSTKD